MNVFNQLIRPWAYLSVCGQRKWFFDWLVPGVLALVAVIALRCSAGGINFFGANGVVASVTGFVQNLPGFFIAALAAIATFNREDLDEKLPDPPLTVADCHRGTWNRVPLTRRRFLSLLFSFLTAQSISITVMGITFMQVAAWLTSTVIMPEAKPFLAIIGSAIYCFLFAQMMSVTCLGLYYLGDRIHRPNDI